MERREQRLADRESRIDAESEQLHRRRRELAAEREDLEHRRVELNRLEEERRKVLEHVAAYTVAEARADLVRTAENRPNARRR